MTDFVEGVDLTEGAGIAITKTTISGTRGDLSSYEIASAVGEDGWVDDTAETWTYASFAAGPPAVGTFTVSGDKTAKYKPGTRIKLTQTTVKYFVVTTSSHAAGTTTVSITGGTVYTLANAAISANHHSYIDAQGYPGWFAYDPGPTGFTGALTGSSRFSVAGRMVTIAMNISGTSNATTFLITLPIPCVSPGGAGWIPVRVTDNGTVQTTPGHFYINGYGSTSNLTVGKTWTVDGGFTNSGQKQLTGGILSYEI